MNNLFLYDVVDRRMSKPKLFVFDKIYDALTSLDLAPGRKITVYIENIDNYYTVEVPCTYTACDYIINDLIDGVSFQLKEIGFEPQEDNDE